MYLFRLAAIFYHLAAQQVVRQQHTPQLLPYSRRLLATQGQSVLLQAVLHLPIAQLDFLAMTVYLDNLGARKAHRVDHQGQHLALLAIDVAGQQVRFQRVRQLRPLLACLWTSFQQDQYILTPQFAHYLIERALFERQLPVPLAAGGLPRVE